MLDLKDKHKTSIALCIEAEIFPHIDDKIQKKVFQKVDQKLQKINDKFVTNKSFEFKIEDLKTKIDDNKDTQTQINDGISDKFDLIFQRLDNIIEECVTHEKLQQDLDKYTKLTRFIVVEEKLETFVTKHMNEVDKTENASTFDRLFGMLEKEYYKVDVIEAKIS